MTVICSFQDMSSPASFAGTRPGARGNIEQRKLGEQAQVLRFAARHQKRKNAAMLSNNVLAKFFGVRVSDSDRGAIQVSSQPRFCRGLSATRAPGSSSGAAKSHGSSPQLSMSWRNTVIISIVCLLPSSNPRNTCLARGKGGHSTHLGPFQLYRMRTGAEVKVQ